MSKNILLISPDILKQRTSIHDNVDEKLLYPEIKTAQDMFIHPILGTALYDKILSDVDSGTITGEYKTLLDDYIIDCLVYYVMAGLPEAISFQIWNKGVVRKQGDFTELPSLSDLVSISDKYRIRAERYGERLNKYLKQNASSSFLPEYVASVDSDDIAPENESYNMPIYLGGDYKVSLDKNNCNG